MIRIVLLLICWPMLVAAQTFPALYDVIGVADNDVLNIRATPSGSAQIVAALAPDALNIEVTATNDAATWARINSGENIGWVSLSYLSRQPEHPERPLARQLACFGTEPFWSAEITPHQKVRFSSPTTDYETPGAGAIIPANGRLDVFGMSYGNSVAIFRRAQCSDGMSDQLYGLQVDLFKQHNSSQSVYSGCCSIRSQ